MPVDRRTAYPSPRSHPPSGHRCAIPCQAMHAAIFGLPLISGVIADTVLAAQISHRNPGLMLLQDANDLIFGKSAALHLWSFRLGQRLSQTGSDPRGNTSGHLQSFQGYVAVIST